MSISPRRAIIIKPYSPTPTIRAGCLRIAAVFAQRLRRHLLQRRAHVRIHPVAHVRIQRRVLGQAQIRNQRGGEALLPGLVAQQPVKLFKPRALAVGNLPATVPR